MVCVVIIEYGCFIFGSFNNNGLFWGVIVGQVVGIVEGKCMFIMVVVVISFVSISMYQDYIFGLYWVNGLIVVSIMLKFIVSMYQAFVGGCFFFVFLVWRVDMLDVAIGFGLRFSLGFDVQDMYGLFKFYVIRVVECEVVFVFCIRF